MLILAAVSAEPAGAGQPDVPADTLATAEVPAGLEDVVVELDQADQPAAWRDMVAAAAAMQASGGSSGPGLAWWRTSGSATGARHDGRIEAASGRWRARASLRMRPGDGAQAAGAAGLRLGPVTVWAGHLALRQGFGLAGTDSGRRGTLAADQALGGIAGGLVPRTTSGAAAGGEQAGCQLVVGRWSLAGLSAVPGRAGAGPAWSARLQRAWGEENRGQEGGRGGVADRGGDEGRRGLLALAAGADSSGRFASFAGRAARAGVTATWEVAGWSQRDGAVGTALVAGAAWRPVPQLRLELQSGLAGSAPRGGAAVLPSGATGGWAARAAWRDRNGGALEVLAQGSRGSARGAEPERRATEVLDAAWERRAGGGVAFELRCRRTSRRDLSWSSRQPWLPGEWGTPQVRTSVLAAVRREANGGRLALEWRSFAVAGSSTDGNRQALSLSGARSWRGDRRRGWEAWFDATTAWGDQVDLVRALVPLPGLVAARHWGGWRSEALVGLGWRGGGLRMAAALARRLPEAGATGADSSPGGAWEGWLEARCAW